jgi:dienelactone hydrolase
MIIGFARPIVEEPGLRRPSKLIVWLGLAIAFTGCMPVLNVSDPPAEPSLVKLVDEGRRRQIPIALYGVDPGHPRPLAVLSPGYGSRNTDYTFLAAELVRQGYVVAAIQHDLDGDPPVPSGDNLAILRRPWWESGVANIRFAAAELRRRSIALDGTILLVGHSHGGDISMLFATLHANEVRAVFSLDNRRMQIPRTGTPRICSVRSSDYPADPGVLPTAEEQALYRMIIHHLPAQRHDDMWDGASNVQKIAMVDVLRRCLAEIERV